jgi:microcystin-dependent protein
MVVDGALATSIAGGTFGLVPIGASVPFHGSTVPTNWLLMDGSTFSGTTYPDLMASLGGTTLPDARGRMIAGTGGIGGSNTQPNLPLGSVGGEQNHTMVTGEMPTHSHPASTGTESQAHAHTADTRDDVYQAAPGTGGGNFALGALSSTFRVAEAVTDNETALHVHSVTVSAVGRGTAMNNMTPYLAAQWIIRAL